MTIHPLWFMVEVKVEVQDFQNERQIDQLKEYSSLKTEKDEKHFSQTSFFTEKTLIKWYVPCGLYPGKKKYDEQRDFKTLGHQRHGFDDYNITNVHLSCDIGNGN